MYGHKMWLLLRDGTRETVWFNAASFFGMYMLIIMLKLSICPNEKYKITTMVIGFQRIKMRAFIPPYTYMYFEIIDINRYS